MLLLLLALAGVALLRLFVGETFGWPEGSLAQSVWDLLRAPWRERTAAVTVMDLRLLRLVIAALLGVALACSGVSLQSLLRNPLAEPYILGLSTGAAVGVMLHMMLAHHLGRPLGPTYMGALAGAGASMAVVYLASRRRGVIDPLGLLLTGVVLSTISGAAIMVLNYLSTPHGLRTDLARWLMGSLNETVEPGALWAVAAVTGLCVAVLWRYGRAMDAAAFSDAEALAMGVPLGRLRKLLFLCASVLAGGAVVLAGPVAFVGLICPHVARLLLGPSHRPLLLGSALVGAQLILVADMTTVALDWGQGRMPLGVFTALLGGPLFLWLLRPHLGHDTF